jgi:uncharacterized membrane protein
MTTKPAPTEDLCTAETTRVEAFSDGVFAIIITLLVLEIHRPEVAAGGLGQALIQGWPFYLAYLMAFLYVGVMWLNHHALFQRIRRVDPTLIWINLGILGTSTLMPFPTGLLAIAFHSGNLNDERAAVVLYALIAGLMSAAWLPMFPYLHKNRQLVHERVPELEFRAQFSRPMVGIVANIAAAMLGWFVNPWLALIIFGGMVAYHALTSQGLRHKGGPAT